MLFSALVTVISLVYFMIMQYFNSYYHTNMCNVVFKFCIIWLNSYLSLNIIVLRFSCMEACLLEGGPHVSHPILWSAKVQFHFEFGPGIPTFSQGDSYSPPA